MGTYQSTTIGYSRGYCVKWYSGRLWLYSSIFDKPEKHTGTNRVTITLEKNCQNFQKIAQKVAKSKKAKISTTKLNLKAQNHYNKPLLKP